MLQRIVATNIRLQLPVPPSINAAYVSGGAGGSLRKTARMRRWEKEVRDCTNPDMTERLLLCTPYGLHIDLPDALRGDIDNYVKPLSDVLMPNKDSRYGVGVIDDDKWMKRLYVSQSVRDVRWCALTLVTLPHWDGYLASTLWPKTI